MECRDLRLTRARAIGREQHEFMHSTMYTQPSSKRERFSGVFLLWVISKTHGSQIQTYIAWEEEKNIAYHLCRKECQ